MSNGKFIGLIHSGDTYNAGALQKVNNLARCLDSSVIYGDILFLENEDGIEIRRYSRANHLNLNMKMSIFHPSTFISKDLYLKFGTYQECFKMAADYNLLLNLYLNGIAFHHLPSPITTFRTDGLSSKNFILNLRDNYFIRLIHFDIFKACHFIVKAFFFFIIYNLRRNILILIFGKKYFSQLKKAFYSK